jgi:multidrug efflux pump subunit AcrA (membrane-fusion protein)
MNPIELTIKEIVQAEQTQAQTEQTQAQAEQLQTQAQTEQTQAQAEQLQTQAQTEQTQAQTEQTQAQAEQSQGEQSQSQADKFISLALNFIETNKKGLIEIYLKHSRGTGENEGEGMLVINLREVDLKQNVEVSFLPYKFAPEELVKQIAELKLKNNDYIIYLMLITPFEQQLIEVDVRSLL